MKKNKHNFVSDVVIVGRRSAKKVVPPYPFEKISY
jgi:hypothetical protein